MQGGAIVLLVGGGRPDYTYLERDIPQLGPRIAAETLRRFWTMLAHSQGSLLNASRLAASQLVERFVENGILDEITGRSRNRVYAYSRYIQLFS